ncbi:MAG: ribonuclease III [Pseudomonadota bacterium]
MSRGRVDQRAAVQRLEEALGHTFSDRSLLTNALLHGSALAGRGQSYERLEFLGDRVLGLVIASALYQRFPKAEEGGLARRLNALVRRETCADRALFLGIDAALRLGDSEAHSGGRKKTAILADACEAVLAAVYLDGGYDAAEAVILRAWGDLIDCEEKPERDPKTELQEIVQASGGAPPSYTVRARTGPDHAPHFVIEVAGHDGVLGAGQGGSKREAEQNAARAALDALSEQP